MAATKTYGLKGGHPNTFRRTVNIGTKDDPNRVQLVFEPGKPQELTAKEIEGLKAEIAEGFIVPWEDHGQGSRPVPTVPVTSTKVAELEGAVEELKAQNAELQQQLADVKVPKKAAEYQAEIKELKAQNAELTKQLEDATAPGASDDQENDADAEGRPAPDAPLGDE